MKQFRHSYLFYLLMLITALASCKKDNKDEETGPLLTSEHKGIYILCEGNFNMNNSSLVYFDYDKQELTDDQFDAVNKRGLGDTGNDIQIYGSKMYIVVNVSSTIEVVNPKTAASIKQIDIKNGDTGRQPRNIVFYKNKALISSFDGTVAVLDTASLIIDKYITVGRNPEQMAIVGDKLYVANSGGLDFDNPDKTVSVVDLTTFTETKKITVGLNPQYVAADKYGDIYVLATGNYTDIPSTMTIIDSQTDEVKSQSAFAAGSIDIVGDYAYIGAGKAVLVYNVKTEKIEKENFVTDGTSLDYTYGVTVDETSGEIFVANLITSSINGEIICFDKNGKKRYSIKKGINPKRIAFLKK